MPDTTPGDGAGPAPVPDLGVAAYLEARSHAEDAVVRAAFDDLRERVRAEVKPPPAGLVVRRARRTRAVAARSRVGVAAAAAVLVMGTAVTLVSQGPGADDATTVATDGAATRSASAAPPTTDAPVTPTTPAPAATATKTLVVTVTPPPASRTRTRTPTGTGAPATQSTTGSATVPPPQPSSSGPSTEVTVYLWQGTLYPACLTQYAVTRRVPGTGGWESAVRAALAGATADEQARGYVSPFGPGVQVQVDEGRHTVDFSSRAVISDTVPGCRTSLDQLVSRTALDAGHSADVRLEGSAVTWLTWKLGLG